MHKAGFHHYQWRDIDRQRPVWVDVWYPAKAEVEELPFHYGLGQGAVAPDAEVVANEGPFPIVVMSHGAFGSARDYGWLAESLARHGFIVLGVSHYQESWLHSPDTVHQSAVIQLWRRPLDCTFALDQPLQHEDFREQVNMAH